MELDDFDRRIVRRLQHDARTPVTALADHVGLSPNATNERLKRLLREGVITGFHAAVSPDHTKRSLLIFAEIKLDRTVPDVFDAFAKAALAAPEVLECHMVAGGFDYLIKTRMADMDAYRQFLSDTLLALPGVRESNTYVVMEEIKSLAVMPI